ncbi:MAG: Protein translocase subunit SecF [Candidatus Yanofskybacteria bacterium GW2011_GWA2_41_22]|uniref:Protein-export membrane protein SecF n=4 Tax=Parcubacteria group TaxID=1794811 RepID=A0A1F8HPF3_9BACT|nr:MAG: Protein translocase subunit SecF [Candidatus Yanofskybacteria bacterium GW2011_GWA2_41_22]KKS23750.1 MAG: Protein translocase subunit SecF [Candidatus Jorgensenbacteria bacterium GW2011_GWF2_41_8]OGM99110.1 MAG: protein-export membrane protein SecF [Candidatus Yanofskybacteria bacterium RIFCSPHIGHO2_01_FULL_41_27]OGN09520.1 MAG: protein-export membrane protein SecF [Candidatus Yanofskybacteria bacterium RIFCSPHIGHO2_02_FULL_41_12]OGN20587.1 MAG: protein-export membrane protein SecF [Can
MKKIYTIVFFISVGLAFSAIVAAGIYGLKFGVDFKGGSVMELNFKNGRPQISEIQSLLSGEAEFKEAGVNLAGQSGIIIKSGELLEQIHQDILKKISTQFPSAGMEELKFDSVGPVIGKELKSKSLSAVIIVLFSIIIYIAIVFRKLSRTISGWAMGVAAIVALAHDVIIPVGVFALLGKFYGIEISAVFVAAILTVLGYSVSDTVVVFDRVRENIIKGGGAGEGFGAVVHKSILQTLTRSLNTTFTTLLSLMAIYLFGGESIKYFALALIMGIFLGAYSSIFVASPLLVWWNGKSVSQKR